MERETIWTTGKVLGWATADFRERGVALPRLEAELLLAHVLGCRRLDLYTDHDRPLDPAELGNFRQVVTRRRRGEPAAYIRGTREFWSLTFGVTPDVLVPRPETEVLVQACLERTDAGRVLDLGTGSGCIAVALASERSELTLHATDISAPACAVARDNAARHGLEERIEIFAGDLFDAVPEGARYAAIVSNPPYVADGELEALDPEVRSEPRAALAGGPDGLDTIRRILAGAPDHLEPGGWLLVEIDPRQAETVTRSLGPEHLGVAGESILDLSGRERVAVFRCKV
jgi:release factor glutamine methyltransferase